MNKRFIVRLSDAERIVCREIIKKLKGSSQKVRRAQICSRQMLMGQHGRTQRSLRLSTVACKRSSMFANGWWSRVLNRLWSSTCAHFSISGCRCQAV